MFQESARDAYIHKNGEFRSSSRDFGDTNFQILERKPPLAVRNSRGGMVLVPSSPFEDAVERITKFFLYQKAKSAFSPRGQVAWISAPDKTSDYDLRAFESRGLSARNIVFLESDAPERILRSVCDEPRVQVIVVAMASTPTAARITKQWLRQRDGPDFALRDEVRGFERERLVLFLE